MKRPENTFFQTKQEIITEIRTCKTADIKRIFEKYHLDKPSDFYTSISKIVHEAKKNLGCIQPSFNTSNWLARIQDCNLLLEYLEKARKNIEGFIIYDDSLMIETCETIIRNYEKTGLLAYFHNQLPKAIKQLLHYKTEGRIITSDSEIIDTVKIKLRDWREEKHMEQHMEQHIESSKKIDELNQVLANKEIKISEYEKGIVLYEQKEINKKLIEENKELKNLNQNLLSNAPSYLVEENSNLKKACEEKSKKISDLTQEKANFAMKLVHLEEKDETREKENSKLTGEIRDLNKKAVERDKKNSELETSIQELKHSNQILLDNMQKMNEWMKNKDQEKNEKQKSKKKVNFDSYGQSTSVGSLSTLFPMASPPTLGSSEPIDVPQANLNGNSGNASLSLTALNERFEDFKKRKNINSYHD